jgi:hypothetical protein
MPSNTLTKPDIERVARRITYELETMLEEGFADGGNWYAIDRLGMIAAICERAIAGDRLACVHGFGREGEADAAYFDVPR